MKNLFFILAFISPLFSYAQTQTSLRSAHALSTEVTSQKVIARLKAGYHFNEQAPNELRIDGTNLKPSLLQKRLLEFTVADASKKSAKAILFVCDDAVTYCETHELQLTSQTTASTPATKAAPKVANKKQRIEYVHGFIQNNLEKAMQMAQPNRLVLIDFSARWCPGCVRFEKEIFPLKEFQALTKNLIKVKVDVDLFENAPWSKKYNVKGIPALIIVNAEGKIIDQIVDFRPMSKLTPFVQSAEQNPMSTDELITRAANKNQSDLLVVGKRLLATGQYEKSLEYLTQVTPPPAQLWTAKIEFAQEKYDANKNEKSAYANTLREALKAESETTRSIGWRTELIKLIDANSFETKTLVAEGQTLADSFFADPVKLKKALETDEAGEMTGYEKMMVGFYLADLMESSKQSEEVIKATWNKVADQSQSLKINPRLSGPALRYLIVLSAAQRFEDAHKWSKELLKYDPTNLDIQRRQMRILVGLKKHDEAIEIGENIIDASEDRNQFWVAESLAKAYIGAERKNAAKQLLKNYLSKPEINADNMKSSKKSMEDLLKTI